MFDVLMHDTLDNLCLCHIVWSSGQNVGENLVPPVTPSNSSAVSSPTKSQSANTSPKDTVKLRKRAGSAETTDKLPVRSLFPFVLLNIKDFVPC